MLKTNKTELNKSRFNLLFKPSFIPSLLFDLFGMAIIIVLLFLSFKGEGFFLGSRYLINVLLFTFFQAGASALLIVILSLFLVPTFRKLSHPFLHTIFNYLVSIPFFVPSLIGCLSLVLLFGQNGLLSHFVSLFNLSFNSFLYGIVGILLCHLFFYIPFVLSQFSLSLQRNVKEYDRLSDSLALTDLAKFRFLYFPLLIKELKPAFVLTFLYCLRSFTIILIFGGTPGNTTLEVALFQTLNYDLDWVMAAQIALLQLLINSSLFYFFRNYKIHDLTLPSNDIAYLRSYALSWLDKTFLFISFVFFILPLCILSWKGIISSSFFRLIFLPEFWQALRNSLLIGLLTTIFGLLFVSFFIYSKYCAKIHNQYKLIPFVSEIPANLSLIFSPLVLGTIFFIFFSDKLDHSLPLFSILAIMNAITFLPNLFLVLSNPFLSQRKRFDYLCSTLEIKGWNRFRYVDWSGLKPAVGYALAICFIFSLGDARTILFFNQNNFPTFITLIYQEMRHYHFAEATSLSAWLIILSIFIFILLQKIFGHHENA